ncbi:MAG: PQQ-binding-like beta-propeller repeat protein [Natronomonas sp.]
MSESREIPLGDVDPCGSRQAGRRSAVCLTPDGPVVGRADGRLTAFDRTGEERWTADGEGSVVTLVPFDGGVLAGERSKRGAIRLFDADGTERWSHETADDIGAPTKETRFFLPFVVDCVAGETAYVAARRYERRDGDRHFESVVYALGGDGTERWRYAADASLIALAAFDGGVAAAYNRCPGDHDAGLVVLADGTERWRWNPGESDRRVGDVAAVDDETLAVTSHADYCGYLLSDGEVTRRIELATPLDRGDDRVYAYPNHVHATTDGAVFCTGNTFPTDGRETGARHPLEHTAVGVGRDGTRRFRADIGGFAHEVATDHERLLVPVAQHFRDRDPAVHGFRLFDVTDGLVDSGGTAGVATAAAVDGDRLAVVEEPVVYHDDGAERGRYALHLRRSAHRQ